MRLYQRGYYTSGPRSTPSLSSGVRCGEEGERRRVALETVRRRAAMDHELAGRGGLGFCCCSFGVATSNSRPLVLGGCSTVGRELPLDEESVGRVEWAGARAQHHARWQPIQASFGQLGRLSDKPWRAAAISLGVGLDEDDEVSVLGEEWTAGRGKTGIMG